MEHQNDLKAVELLIVSQHQDETREQIKWEMHWSEKKLAKYEKMLADVNKCVDQLAAALKAGMTRDAIARSSAGTTATLPTTRRCSTAALPPSRSSWKGLAAPHSVARDRRVQLQRLFAVLT